MPSDRLIEGFRRWQAQATEAMNTVADLLEVGDYREACRILDVLSKHHAQMALGVKNVLIRSGRLKLQENGSEE